MNDTEARVLKKTSSKEVFFNLGLFQFLTFVRRGVFYTFMINYLNKLVQIVTLTAALGTLNMVASALGQNLLWGKICDRHKLRTKLIIIGETIAAFVYIAVFLIHKSLINLGSGFSAGLAIIFGLSILEFFWSMSDVGWAALLTDVTTSEIRGKVIGTLNFIASLGRMVGILYAGFLYNDGEGFQNGTIFYVVIILLLAGTAIMTWTSRKVKTRNHTTDQCTTKEKDENENNLVFDNKEAYKWFLVSLIIIIIGAASINQVFLLFLKLKEGVNASDPEMSLILTAWTIGGMIASLLTGTLADRIGRSKVMLIGLGLAIVTPLLYSVATSVLLMVPIYALNGVSFWTVQTAGFALAGDLIPQQKRGRLLSRYNTVIALGWGPAGFLIGGPLADIQVKWLGLSTYTAYLNTFYASSIIITLGTILFASKIAKRKLESNT